MILKEENLLPDTSETETSNKAQFITEYNSEIILNEFLYNLIEFSLSAIGVTNSSATRYDKNACTYMVYEEDLDFEKIRKTAIDLISEIQKIDLLYDYNDSRGIFLDKKPIYCEKTKTFKYLPFRKIYAQELFLKQRDDIIEILKKAKMTKKSSLYKVWFSSLNQV